MLALTGKVTNLIIATTTVLTRVGGTVINVRLTTTSGKATRTVTKELVEVILASATI